MTILFNIKKFLYAIAVFIVLLIIVQVFVSAIISSIFSGVYLRSLITLLISIGLAFYVTRRIIHRKRNTQKKLYK